MARIPERRSLRRRLRPYFTVFDWPLGLVLFVLMMTSVIIMSSAGAEFPDRLEHQIRNFLLAFVIFAVSFMVVGRTMVEPIVAAVAENSTAAKVGSPCQSTRLCRPPSEGS